MDGAGKMNEVQYAWSVRNRRAYGARTLFGAADGARLLASTMRRAAQRTAAADAWAEVAPPALRDAVEVTAFEGGCLELEVSSAAAGHYLRQRLRGLRRELAGILPGLRQVRVVNGRGAARSTGQD